MRIKDLTIQPDATIVENMSITPTVQRLLESDADQDKWVEFADVDSFLAHCDKVIRG